jgi:hypothetical protein
VTRACRTGTLQDLNELSEDQARLALPAVCASPRWVELVAFTPTEQTDHCQVPVLLSPCGYSTYRGS